MRVPLVAGVDSSTQSTKVLLCRAEDGEVVGQGTAPHPGGTECDPAAWRAALQQAGEGLLDRAGAVAVAGQQHGMVVLSERGEVIRPALLWNDLRSSGAAVALIAERGGPRWWAAETGSVPNASFTVTKLRWLAEHEPAHAAQVARVMLPHDWITWQLGAAEPVTDRGDASGTGYFSTRTGQWLPGVAAAALGHQPQLPRVAAPAEIVGRTAEGAAIGPGTGDNMAAALGLGLEPGEVAVSIGTSGTAFALSRRALAAEPGAGGITLLPYLDGERTPDRPHATGVLSGLTTRNATPENLARAAVEAVLASLADVTRLLGGQGVEMRSVLLIGGGARSEAVRRLAPGIFGVDVDVPEPAEYVALGAARQAAWALAGTPAPPAWPRRPTRRYSGPPQPAIADRFAALRDATRTWSDGPGSAQLREVAREGPAP